MSVEEMPHLGEGVCPSYGSFEAFWRTGWGRLAQGWRSGRPAAQQPAQPAVRPPAGAVTQGAVATAAVVPVRAAAVATAAQRLAILSCHAAPVRTQQPPPAELPSSRAAILCRYLVPRSCATPSRRPLGARGHEWWPSMPRTRLAHF